MWNIQTEQQNLQSHFWWLIYSSLSLRSQKHLAVCWWQDLWLWNFSGISCQRLTVHKSILIAILHPRKFCFHITAVRDGELQQRDVIYRLQLSLCLLCPRLISYSAFCCTQCMWTWQYWESFAFLFHFYSLFYLSLTFYFSCSISLPKHKCQVKMIFFALSLLELLQPNHWMDQEAPEGNYLGIKGGSHSVYTKNVFSSLPENGSMSVTLKLIREIFSVSVFRHHPASASPPWVQDKYFVFLLSIGFPVLSLLLLLLCVDKHCCPWSYMGLFVKI